MNPGRASRYVVGSGERCIILVYDIHGFAPANTQHNCDLLADAGFLVVMPDFFRGSGRGQEGLTGMSGRLPPTPTGIKGYNARKAVG